MKVRDVIRLVEADGWRHVRTRGVIGSSITPANAAVTIQGKPNDELAPGTLNSMLKQAGLK